MKRTQYVDIDLRIDKTGEWWVWLPGTSEVIASGRSRFATWRLFQIRRAVRRYLRKLGSAPWSPV